MARIPLSQNDDWQLDGPDVQGREVRDEDGTRLGRVKDLFVNTETRAVEAILLDDGTRLDVRHARADEGGGPVIVERIPAPGTNPEIYHAPDRDTDRPGDLGGAHRRADVDPKRAQYVGEYHTHYSIDADDPDGEPDGPDHTAS